MLVARQRYVLVDGGRAYLPIPLDHEKLLVARWDHDFVRLWTHCNLSTVSEVELATPVAPTSTTTFAELVCQSRSSWTV